MDASHELAEILIACFVCDIDTEQEKKLHEDVYVKKKLRQHLGKKDFDKYDELKEQIWKDAWRQFDKIAINKNT
ncbi:hypothetical protein ABHN03_03930 [Paenibacillus sp. NRS-1775]|uniref:hypothetical protein n=1 Tax=unclassified Paenibacillus TaxID=185978 RepID=UPI003D2C78B0